MSILKYKILLELYKALLNCKSLYDIRNYDIISF